MRSILLLSLVALGFGGCAGNKEVSSIRTDRDAAGFVDIKTMVPDIQVQAAYFSDWNFVGRPIHGYHANKCFLTSQAAKALDEVQKEISKQGYSLLVFDCYRPQRAVDDFAAWARDPDLKQKAIFYPEEPKNELFERGYIAAKSGHSRGSTVDLTIVRTRKYHPEKFYSQIKMIRDCRKSKGVEAFGQLDMGTTFDCFSELASTDHPAISEKLRANRNFLRTMMEKHGFKNYAKEWWHYTLKDEPYPNDYFDFEVR